MSMILHVAFSFTTFILWWFKNDKYLILIAVCVVDFSGSIHISLFVNYSFILYILQCCSVNVFTVFL